MPFSALFIKLQAFNTFRKAQIEAPLIRTWRLLVAFRIIRIMDQLQIASTVNVKPGVRASFPELGDVLVGKLEGN